MWSGCSGLSAPWIGVVSIRTGDGRGLRASGLFGRFFTAGNWIGKLDNGGVGLTYGGVEVPAELKAEVEALIPEIVSGAIKTIPDGRY